MKKNHKRKSSSPVSKTAKPTPSATATKNPDVTLPATTIEDEAQGFVPMSDVEVDKIAQNITAALEKIKFSELPTEKLSVPTKKISLITPSEGDEFSDEEKKHNYIFLSAIAVAVCFFLWVGATTISTLSTPPPANPMTSSQPTENPDVTPSPEIGDEDKPSTDDLVIADSIVTPEPTATPQRPLATKTEVYKMLSDVGVGSKYATLYAPNSGIDSPIYFGDSTDILMLPAIAQSSQTYQIGYSSSHLMCSYEPSIAKGIKSMKIGERFSVETSYGIYVYSVVSATIGSMNNETGYIVDGAGNNLFSLNDTADTIYLYTDYNAEQQYVVKATLCA